MANTLEFGIDREGFWDPDLVKYLENVQAIVNEVITDHALIRANLVALMAKLDGDAGITDTDYVSKLGASGSVAALPATLTNSTALKLTKG